MEQLSELRAVFKLDSTSLNSITRKSLLKWAREVEFEDRRDKFYTASCDGKLKSRVSICQKKGKRPDWTVRLDMLKTPKIRVAIKAFLSDLGIHPIPKKKDLASLSREKHWKLVLFLDEEALKDAEEKTGGAREDAPGLPADANRESDLRPRKGKPKEKNPFNYARDKRNPTPVSSAKKKPKPRVRGRRKPKVPPPQYGPHAPMPVLGHGRGRPTREQQKRLAEARKNRASPQWDDMTREQKDVYASNMQAGIVELGKEVRLPKRDDRPRVGDLAIKREMGARGVRFANRVEVLGDGRRVIDLSEPGEMLNQRAIERLEERLDRATGIKESMADKQDSLLHLGAGESVARPMRVEDMAGGFFDQPRTITDEEGRECFLIDEEERFDCRPMDLEQLKLTRKDQKRIYNLAVLRKETCEKINLLRLKYEEAKWQRKAWEELGRNNKGDLLALFSKDSVTKLKKCKKEGTVFNPAELTTMLSVAHCLGKTKDICKSFGEHEKRLVDKKILGDRSYTLGNVSDDDLVRKWNQEQDPWSKLALRNRVRNEPEETRKIHCVPARASDGTMINIQKVGHVPDKVKECKGPNCVGMPLAAGTMAARGGGGTTVIRPAPGPGPPPPPGRPAAPMLTGRNQSFARAMPGRPPLVPTNMVSYRPHPTSTSIGVGGSGGFGGTGGTIPPSPPIVLPPYIPPETTDECADLTDILFDVGVHKGIPSQDKTNVGLDLDRVYMTAGVNEEFRDYANKLWSYVPSVDVPQGLDKAGIWQFVLYTQKPQWVFPKDKWLFFVNMTQGFCNLGSYEEPLLDKDLCRRIEQYMFLLKDQWITSEMWSRFIADIESLITRQVDYLRLLEAQLPKEKKKKVKKAKKIKKDKDPKDNVEILEDQDDIDEAIRLLHQHFEQITKKLTLVHTDKGFFRVSFERLMMALNLICATQYQIPDLGEVLMDVSYCSMLLHKIQQQAEFGSQGDWLETKRQIVGYIQQMPDSWQAPLQTTLRQLDDFTLRPNVQDRFVLKLLVWRQCNGLRIPDARAGLDNCDKLEFFFEELEYYQLTADGFQMFVDLGDQYADAGGVRLEWETLKRTHVDPQNTDPALVGRVKDGLLRACRNPAAPPGPAAVPIISPPAPSFNLSNICPGIMRLINNVRQHPNNRQARDELASELKKLRTFSEVTDTPRLSAVIDLLQSERTIVQNDPVMLPLQSIVSKICNLRAPPVAAGDLLDECEVMKDLFLRSFKGRLHHTEYQRLAVLYGKYIALIRDEAQKEEMHRLYRLLVLKEPEAVASAQSWTSENIANGERLLVMTLVDLCKGLAGTGAAVSAKDKCLRLIALLEICRQDGYGAMQSLQKEEMHRLWHYVIEVMPGDISQFQTWLNWLKQGSIPDAEWQNFHASVMAVCNGGSAGIQTRPVYPKLENPELGVYPDPLSGPGGPTLEMVNMPDLCRRLVEYFDLMFKQGGENALTRQQLVNLEGYTTALLSTVHGSDQLEQLINGLRNAQIRDDEFTQLMKMLGQICAGFEIPRAKTRQHMCDILKDLLVEMFEIGWPAMDQQKQDEFKQLWNQIVESSGTDMTFFNNIIGRLMQENRGELVSGQEVYVLLQRIQDLCDLDAAQEPIPDEIMQMIVPALEEVSNQAEFLEILRGLASGQEYTDQEVQFVVREFKQFLPAFTGNVYTQVAYFLQGLELGWFPLNEYPGIFGYLLENWNIRINPVLGQGQVVPVPAVAPDAAADLQHAVGLDPAGRIPAPGQPGGSNLPGIAAPPGGRIPAAGQRGGPNVPAIAPPPSGTQILPGGQAGYNPPQHVTPGGPSAMMPYGYAQPAQYKPAPIQAALPGTLQEGRRGISQSYMRPVINTGQSRVPITAYPPVQARSGMMQEPSRGIAGSYIADPTRGPVPMAPTGVQSALPGTLQEGRSGIADSYMKSVISTGQSRVPITAYPPVQADPHMMQEPQGGIAGSYIHNPVGPSPMAPVPAHRALPGMIQEGQRRIADSYMTDPISTAPTRMREAYPPVQARIGELQEPDHGISGAYPRIQSYGSRIYETSSGSDTDSTDSSGVVIPAARGRSRAVVPVSQQLQRMGRAVSAFQFQRQRSMTPDPDRSDVRGFIQNPADPMSNLPVQMYVLDARSRDRRDSVIARDLSEIGGLPVSSTDLSSAFDPSQTYASAPAPTLSDQTALVPYMGPAVTDNTERQRYTTDRGRYNVLLARYESLQSALRDMPHGPELQQEERETMNELQSLGHKHGFIPPIRKITKDSTAQQIRQREQDSKDALERTNMNLQNVATVQNDTRESIVNLKRKLKDEERDTKKDEREVQRAEKRARTASRKFLNAETKKETDKLGRLQTSRDEAQENLAAKQRGIDERRARLEKMRAQLRRDQELSESLKAQEDLLQVRKSLAKDDLKTTARMKKSRKRSGAKDSSSKRAKIDAQVEAEIALLESNRAVLSGRNVLHERHETEKRQGRKRAGKAIEPAYQNRLPELAENPFSEKLVEQVSDKMITLDADDRKRVLAGMYDDEAVKADYHESEKRVIAYKDEWERSKKRFDELFKTGTSINDNFRKLVDSAVAISQKDRAVLTTYKRRQLYKASKTLFDELKRSVPDMPFKFPKFKEGQQVMSHAATHKLRAVVEALKGGWPVSIIVIQELLGSIDLSIPNFESTRQGFIDEASGKRALHQEAAVRKFRMKKVVESARSKSKEYGSRLLAVRSDAPEKPKKKRRPDPKGGAIQAPKSFSSVFR